MSKKLSTSKIKVMGQDWTIEFWDEIIDDDGDHLQGDSDSTTRIIRVSKKFPVARQKDTLIHEYIHSILAVSGVGQFLSTMLEEAIVVAVENGIVNIVEISEKTNPLFQKNQI